MATPRQAHVVGDTSIVIPSEAANSREDVGESPSPLISVIMLVKDGGAPAIETARAIMRQQLPGDHLHELGRINHQPVPIELLVIDSGSSDGTPEALERLAVDTRAAPVAWELRIYRIEPAEFNFGGTRNVAASLARGRILVFVSADATPVGEQWLAALTAPFADEHIAASYCRQVPRAAASWPERFALRTAYPPRSTVHTPRLLTQLNASHVLYSNASGAVRRTAWEQIPFDETLIGCEDQHWAIATLSAGHHIAYVARACVAHSHLYSLRSISTRAFDNGVALAALPSGIGASSYGAYLRYLRREMWYILRCGGLEALPWSGAYEICRALGYALGVQHRRLPVSLCRRLTQFPGWFDQRRPPLSTPSRIDHDAGTQLGTRASWSVQSRLAAASASHGSEGESATVSIIITSYNYGRYLAEAINSALSQTWPADEIIVVDDGSTDDSLEVAHRFEGVPTVRIISQENQGPAQALNNGVSAATTEFFLKLDPDDKLDPHFIERTVPVLAADAAAAYVYTACRYFGMWQGILPAPPYDEAELRFRPRINANSLMRKKAFEQVGGYSQAMARTYEDWDLYLSLSEHGWRGIALPEPLVHYRKHSAGRSSITFTQWLGAMTVLYGRHPSMRREPLPVFLTRAVFDRGSRRVLGKLFPSRDQLQGCKVAQELRI